jgi:hypothetical protein
VRHASLALVVASCCKVGAATTPISNAELEDARRSEAARPGAGFASAVVSPFVVVAEGDDVRDDAVATIAWAQRGLRGRLFDREPGKVLAVWVFPDEERYMRGSSAILGVIPSTPYGFYRPCSRSLVVNAGYGWGTLVHELVHAYMSADFPDAPVWLQEGLASLYEAPIDDGARPRALRGAVNWRLPGLQRAIQRRRAPSLQTMARSSRAAFDGEGGATLYAAARYLLFYLDETRQLERFYKAFRANVAEDETGLATLRAVTQRDLPGLEREWEAFVLALRYERGVGGAAP